MFYSTQGAVEYGLNMKLFDRPRLEGLREIFQMQCYDALSRDCFDLASWMATQAQFCREALDAEKIVKNNPDFFVNTV